MSWASAAASKVQQSHSMQAQDSPTDRISAFEVDHGDDSHDVSHQQPENGPASPQGQAPPEPKPASRPSPPTSSGTGLAIAPGHAVWADVIPPKHLCALPAEPEALLGMVLYVVSTLAMSAQSTMAKVLGEATDPGGAAVHRCQLIAVGCHLDVLQRAQQGTMLLLLLASAPHPSNALVDSTCQPAALQVNRVCPCSHLCWLAALPFPLALRFPSFMSSLTLSLAKSKASTAQVTLHLLEHAPQRPLTHVRQTVGKHSQCCLQEEVACDQGPVQLHIRLFALPVSVSDAPLQLRGAAIHVPTICGGGSPVGSWRAAKQVGAA